jgi:hypothetical protein
VRWSVADAAVDALAETYWLEKGRSPQSPWPWEAVYAISKIKGAGARFLIALAERAVTDDQISYLAAGPLEDILQECDEDNLTILASELDISPSLAKMLYCVYQPSTERGRSWLSEQRKVHPLKKPTDK